MAIFHNIAFRWCGTYENELRVGKAIDVPTNSYMRRDSNLDAVHNGRSTDAHPTLAHVIKCRTSNLFTKGSYEAEMSWTAGDYTEAEVNAYITLAMTGAPSNFTNVLDFANNKLTFIVSDTDLVFNAWTDHRLDWMLDCGPMKITATSTCDILCGTVLNNQYDNYDIKYRTIEAGASITIDKTGSTYCFLTFTGVVTKDGTDLVAYRTYNQTSAQLTITNNTSTRIRVLKYSR